MVLELTDILRLKTYFFDKSNVLQARKMYDVNFYGIYFVMLWEIAYSMPVSLIVLFSFHVLFY